MGKFQRGTNEAGFDDVAFNTKVNTVSPVFLDSLGYQFVKVTDSTPAGTVPLAEARNIIGPKLAEAKQRQKEGEYVQDLLTQVGRKLLPEAGRSARADAGTDAWWPPVALAVLLLMAARPMLPPGLHPRPVPRLRMPRALRRRPRPSLLRRLRLRESRQAGSRRCPSGGLTGNRDITGGRDCVSSSAAGTAAATT